ncbi:MAG TPA: hypothetical protein VF691_08960 [Cytophagaceae bacterium]|jgi:hypothetical protein
MRNYLYLKFIVSALFVATIAIGCKKYEEGPTISLRSKRARATNVWQVERAFIQGLDSTAKFYGYRLIMTKEGYYSFSPPPLWAVSFSIIGSWEFSKDKKSIYIHYKDAANKEVKLEYRIYKLMENEFWVFDAASKLEFRFIPA